MEEKGNKQEFPRKEFYTTQEVADILRVSQPTLILWLRNRMIEDVPRDDQGRRLWTEKHIKKLFELKKREGWS